jgi:hypothetical protein
MDVCHGDRLEMRGLLESRYVAFPNNGAPGDPGMVFVPTGLVEALSDGRRGRHVINPQTEAETRVRVIRLDLIKVALVLGQEPDIRHRHIPMAHVWAEILGNWGPI